MKLKVFLLIGNASVTGTGKGEGKRSTVQMVQKKKVQYKQYEGRLENSYDLHISQIWTQQAFVAHESSQVEQISNRLFDLSDRQVCRAL